VEVLRVEEGTAVQAGPVTGATEALRLDSGSRVHLASDRVVFTYEVEGRDLGILTGYEQDGGFFLEHVVAFPGAPLSTLPRMFRAGISEAWARGFKYIALYIEHEHPFAEKLEELAERYEFRCYADREGRAYYCRHRKTHETPKEIV